MGNNEEINEDGYLELSDDHRWGEGATSRDTRSRTDPNRPKLTPQETTGRGLRSGVGRMGY